MNKKKIIVDVDQTVVDTLPKWIKWYEEKSGKEFSWKNYVGGDLSKNMPDIEDNKEFWRDSHLYDDLIPVENSVEIFELLSHNYEIVFLSTCYKEHEESKRKFLEKYFPFCDFIAVYDHADKKKYKSDIFVDDYIKNIIDNDSELKIHILIDSEFTNRLNDKYRLFKDNSIDNNDNIIEVYSFEELLEIINEYSLKIDTPSQGGLFFNSFN